MRHHDEDVLETTRHSALSAYVRDLGRCPLLPAEEQRRLAELMRDTSRSPCDREAARRRLLESNLRFAFALAKQHQGRGVDLAELVADANLGLTRAIEHYDPSFGVPFVGYAAWWIRHAIREGIARQRHSVAVPSRRLTDIARLNRAMHLLRARLGRAPTPNELAEATGLSLPLTIALLRVGAGTLSLDDGPTTGSPSSDQAPARNRYDVLEASCELAIHPEESCTHEAVQKALGSLSPREREVIVHSFGLCHCRAANNVEIARMLNLSPERVRQLRARALMRLRRGQRTAVLHELWAD